MNVSWLVRRAMSVLGLAILFTVGPGPVLAATTLTLDPDTARSGTRVAIYNACLGVTATPPSELRTAFVSASAPGLVPTDPAVVKSVARAQESHHRYVVTVPDLPPGSYDVRLECLPGDWRTNTAEGGATLLTVTAGVPATTTSQSAAPSPGGDPLRILVIAGSLLVGCIGMDRQLGIRRATSGRG